MTALHSEKAGKDKFRQVHAGRHGWGLRQRQVASGVRPTCDLGQAGRALWGISLS